MQKEIVLSKKYQIAIPKSVREVLGLRTGDRVKLSVVDDKVTIEKSESIDDIRREIATYISPKVKPVTNVSQYYHEHRFKGMK